MRFMSVAPVPCPRCGDGFGLPLGFAIGDEADSYVSRLLCRQCELLWDDVSTAVGALIFEDQYRSPEEGSLKSEAEADQPFLAPWARFRTKGRGRSKRDDSRSPSFAFGPGGFGKRERVSLKTLRQEDQLGQLERMYPGTFWLEDPTDHNCVPNHVIVCGVRWRTGYEYNVICHSSHMLNSMRRVVTEDRWESYTSPPEDAEILGYLAIPRVQIAKYARQSNLGFTNERLVQHAWEASLSSYRCGTRAPDPRPRVFKATPGDAAALASIRFEVCAESGDVVETREHFLQRCSDWMRDRLTSNSSWHCWRDRDSTAYLWLQIADRLPNPLHELEAEAYCSIYVRPARGNAESRRRAELTVDALVAAAIGWCRQNAVGSVVVSDSPAAAPVLDRMGFEGPANLREYRC
jgi:hypothetical protein